MREEQEFERAWWGDCCNSFGEEAKQISYAYRMGLVALHQDGKWPIFDLRRRSVLDLGGGPSSLLLKCINGGTMKVVDPCRYPDWVAHRYVSHGIGYVREPAESYRTQRTFDECWIYNVLQHVVDVGAVIGVARRSASVVRIFEWIDVPPHPGHPHELKREVLDLLLGGAGAVEEMSGENGCVGRAYYGVFR